MFALCPHATCVVIIVTHGARPQQFDVGLALARHIDAEHPEILYGSAEAQRRRLARQVQARAN